MKKSGFDGDDNTLTSQEARKAYMEGIHVGFARRICTDASSKPLPIATYCLRTFHRLGTNPTVKTALHLPWSDFRASFCAEDAGIQEYSKDDNPEITGQRPCQSARIPVMYAPVFSPVDLLFRRRVRSSQGVAVAAHVRRRDDIFYFNSRTLCE